jgi:hypothetical protein
MGNPSGWADGRGMLVEARGRRVRARDLGAWALIRQGSGCVIHSDL